MANDIHSDGQINGSYGSLADTDDGSHFNHSNGCSAHTIEADKIEAIAVVGLALKFPQEATDPNGFWQLLVEGRSAMTDVPANRFNIDAFRHKGPHSGATIAARGGHFVKEDPAGFDAPFFSINPAEAASMDPQHRWLLETAYQALENAGIPLEKVAGSKSSVHVELMFHDYEAMLSRDPDIDAQYRGSGLALSMASNRLSWFFDFRGPSLTIDTACSSSLSALHLACQSLRIGESNMGVVGGCNLMLGPDTTTYLSDMNFLSPDNRSYSFDHRANGYARGEGVAVVILKRLTDALRDGDMVRAVIRATGVNQDGRTLGITQPSKEAQYQLIRDTYHDGGIDIAATRYFESHGTGTQAGDPIEAAAIRAAFDNHKPLYVGALKSNIGHLEGASGVAAINKTILVLEKGLISPNLWFERPNPKIPTDAWNFRFPIEPTLWPTDGLRRASINSFGFGGANAVSFASSEDGNQGDV